MNERCGLESVQNLGPETVPPPHFPPLKTEAKASLGSYIVGAPMDRVATDITGPFPTSDVDVSIFL